MPGHRPCDGKHLLDANLTLKVPPAHPRWVHGAAVASPELLSVLEEHSYHMCLWNSYPGE